MSEGRTRRAGFIASLIGDVLAARRRLSTSRSETARRDVVRASLAAIEGITWMARDHVRIALGETQQLTPVAELALRELSYSVAENGRVIELTRPLPMLTAIQLVVRQAREICPDLSVDYSTRGWSNLRRAVEIRNRITHPKSARDLAISDGDLAIVASAVSWLAATVEYVMASTNLALADYVDHARDIVQRLVAGDADALAEYEAALRQIDED